MECTGVDTVAPRTVPYLRGICKIVFSWVHGGRGSGNLTAAGESALASGSYVDWYVTVG